MTLLISLLIVFCGLGAEFLFSALLVKIICWAFGFIFSWKMAIGVFAVLLLLSLFLKSKTEVKK